MACETTPEGLDAKSRTVLPWKVAGVMLPTKLESKAEIHDGLRIRETAKGILEGWKRACLAFFSTRY